MYKYLGVDTYTQSYLCLTYLTVIVHCSVVLKSKRYVVLILRLVCCTCLVRIPTVYSVRVDITTLLLYYIYKYN